MHNHLRMKHPTTKATVSETHTKKQTSIGEFCKRPITERRRQVITDLLVDFIVKDIRPLSAVSGEGFRGIINFFEPSYTVPSNATLWKTIGHKYDSLKADIASEMKGKNVSLTTDLWTSCTMDPYITITAHYINELWKLKSRVLCTTIMPGRHTAVNIAQKLTETINEWELRIFCTVHDNANNMNLAMEICEALPHHIGCSGHTLQLAVKAGLDLPVVSKAVDAARRVVSHFRHSSVATRALKARQEQLSIRGRKLQSDCATRWNSTFDMLDRLYEQRIPVQAVLADEAVTNVQYRKTLAIKSSCWDLIEQLLPILSPLAKATTIMCGELHVGLSFLYPVIINLTENTLRPSAGDLTGTQAFKETVRKQLVTRFKLDSETVAKSLPISACMLDPRFKRLLFLPEKAREDAKAHLTDLLHDSEITHSETSGEQDFADCSGTTNALPSEHKKPRLEADLEELFGFHYKSRNPTTKQPTTSEDEIQDFFQMPDIPTLGNPLEWWACNGHQFPRLSKLAKSCLAVPATSTPSERIFSLAGNTVTRQRSSLHPSHVDALVFLNAN
nr:zinc finger BED domain-containing protein 4-like [Misgurnus anguillicaudatus]